MGDATGQFDGDRRAASPSRDALSPGEILRRASGLSTVSVVSAAIALPTSFLAARWVGPRDFGRAQLVLLVYFFAALLRTGVFEGGVREFVHWNSVGDRDRAEASRDVGFSVELVASAIPGIVLALAAFLARDSLHRVGFALAPLTVLATSTSAFFGALYLAERRFKVLAWTNVVRVVVVTSGTLGGISLVGPAALFIAPAVADLSMVVVLAFFNRGSTLRLSFDRARAWQLFRIGFPIGAATVVYWIYRLVGTTSIAIARDTTALGVYTFAIAPVTVLARALAQVQGVLTPSLWSEMAEDIAGSEWRRQARRVTLVLTIAAAALTNLAQAGFGPMVSVAAPRFVAAEPLFTVLSGNIVLLTIAAVPAIALQSAAVNRQARGLLLLVLALAINVAANVVVVRLGGGSLAIAWNELWVQALLVVAIFKQASPYVETVKGRLRLYVSLVGLTLVAAAVGAVLHATFQPVDGPVDAALAILARTGFVVAVWSAVLAGAIVKRQIGRRTVGAPM